VWSVVVDGQAHEVAFVGADRIWVDGDEIAFVTLTRFATLDAIRAFALVKKAFDPANIFNAGVKVPLPNQKAITDIKYDPLLPPLPERARTALDDMVKDRAYDRFRLSLIGGSS
jgi:hypothetical protein